MNLEEHSSGNKGGMYEITNEEGTTGKLEVINKSRE